MLTQAQKVIGEDEENRKKLEEELERKMKLLEELKQKESLVLEQKVKEKMKKVLAVSARRVLEAEKDKREAISRIGELDLKVKSLEESNNQLKNSLKNVNSTSSAEENKAHSLHETIVELADSNKTLKASNQLAHKQIGALTEELNKAKLLQKEITSIVTKFLSMTHQTE